MTTPLRRHTPWRTGTVTMPERTLRDEVLAGLRARRKTLPPKLFYDTRGAELFEQITAQPEYYLTSAEIEILERRAPELARRVGPRAALIEYGSGAGIKVRLLLDALEQPVACVPIDISGEQLDEVATTLRQLYPDVEILPVRADYTRPIALPPLPGRARRVAFFPGSTIGNFEPAAAESFLAGIRHTVGDDGALILGVDRRKDAATLEAAYDDANGVTAAFNRNMLVRLNRELGADFSLDHFVHRATWNDEASRIEMHLVSLADQVVTVAGMAFPFEAGETIWTEASYKYDRERLEALAATAGFRIEALWTDRQEQFWVGYLQGETRDERR
jgi:dimethylhistidine N-methyltransferase